MREGHFLNFFRFLKLLILLHCAGRVGLFLKVPYIEKIGQKIAL